MRNAPRRERIGWRTRWIDAWSGNPCRPGNAATSGASGVRRCTRSAPAADRAAERDATLGYTPLVTDLSDPLAQAWTSLIEHWDDDARHHGFIALAAQFDRLADAAALYRSVEADPARAEQAAEGKQRIVARAMAQLEALPRASMESAKRRGRVVLPVALMGFLVAMDFLMRAATGNRAFVSWPALGLEIAIVALLPWKRILR
jgi:hypothetical protein